MSGVLIDTNVISEITKPARSERVMTFLDRLQEGYVSVVTLHELDYGLARLAPGARRTALSDAIERFLALYDDRVLAVGVPEARAAATLRAGQTEQGRSLHFADALIAATALVHGLTLATRNTANFTGLGVPLIDPWMHKRHAPPSPHSVSIGTLR